MRGHIEATSDSGIDWSWSPKCRGGGLGFLSPFSEPLDLLLLIGERSGFTSKKNALHCCYSIFYFSLVAGSVEASPGMSGGL
jgi:hypothetical protein